MECVKTQKFAEDMEDIIQIIPAQGWKAWYGDNGKIYSDPLVCWALTAGHEVKGCIDDDGYIMVEDSETTNFLGFLAPGQRIPKHWKKRAKSHTFKWPKQKSSHSFVQLIHRKLKNIFTCFKIILDRV